MIDGSEKRNRQLVFELQDSHVCEKRSNKDVIIIKPLIIALLFMKIALFLALMPFRKCLKLFGRPGGSMTVSDFPGYKQQLPGNLKS